MTLGLALLRLGLVLVLATGSLLAADWPLGGTDRTSESTDGGPTGGNPCSGDSEVKAPSDEEATVGMGEGHAHGATAFSHPEWGLRRPTPALAGAPTPPPERA